MALIKKSCLTTCLRIYKKKGIVIEVCHMAHVWNMSCKFDTSLTSNIHVWSPIECCHVTPT